jgi:hypothetical protein|tara:strand:- start:19 stop:168 length:150 start_codon:yes stop_codon:yes gene_type:complete
MKTIDQSKKDIEWYRLYANYIEYHFTLLDESATEYANKHQKKGVKNETK